MSHFTFARTGCLISRPENMPEPGPYYTTLVDMADVAGFPFDYALYFSTDHHKGEGGIYLYVCNGVPTDAANWKSYDQAVAEGNFEYLVQKPMSNPIFLDAVQGNGHTETPHANVIKGTVYMTYHKNGINNSQATLLATSTDGVNFVRIRGDADSVVLSYDPQKDVGDGHTGYFRWCRNPFAGIVEKYVGYSLHGGGDDYHSAIWVSDNAVDWQKAGVFTPIEGFAVEADRMIIWHELDPASVTRLDSGEYVAICGVGNRASGGVARISELYQIYLASDGQTLLRKSCKLLGRGDVGAPDAEELASATTMRIGDAVHLIYVGVTGQGRINTIMGAIGRVDKTSPDSARLPVAEQQCHFYRP